MYCCVIHSFVKHQSASTPAFSTLPRLTWPLFGLILCNFDSRARVCVWLLTKIFHLIAYIRTKFSVDASWGWYTNGTVVIRRTWHVGLWRIFNKHYFFHCSNGLLGEIKITDWVLFECLFVFLLGVGVVFPKLLLGWFLTYWKRLLPVGSTFTMASELGFLARSFTVFRYTNK